MKLKIKNEEFLDEEGRMLLFRGVNLGWSSKVPYNLNGAIHIKTDFKDHRNVSFVGRPFLLKEADSSIKALKSFIYLEYNNQMHLKLRFLK